jgi:hypothetical protein
MDWSLLLFILKWIFLGLVYLALLLLLVGVTREMRLRLPQTAPQTSISYGRLRVLQAGSDPRLRAGAIVPLQPETNLGAQRGNTLVLRDKFISGHHARIRWDGVSWWVEDLNSTNGTYINRQRIAPGASEPFPPGAVLEVGDIVFEMLD